MNKKGFTLIEIIISITLITIIGVSSVVGIKYVNENIRISELNEITDKALLAAKVYIETNRETYNQLYQKQNAVMIPLNVLVNEGLLNLENTDLTINDYKDEYVITMLTEELGSGECIDIRSETSWNEKMNKPIYICTNKTEKYNNLKDKLKYNSSNETYVAKGEKPNNWVEFEVTSDTSKVAYFPNDSDKNLWRIVSIDEDNQIKIIYSKPTICNNNLMYDTTKTHEGFYELIYYDHIPNSLSGSKSYYKYRDNGWNILEILDNENNLKKNALYESINNNNWIVNTKFYPYYSLNNSSYNKFQNLEEFNEAKINILNEYEIIESYNLGKSWLSNYNLFLGIDKRFENGLSRTYSYSLMLFEGNIMNIGYLPPDAISCGSSFCFELLTNDYHPVITLNANVDLVKQTCPEGMELGSKECPYKLECKNC